MEFPSELDLDTQVTVFFADGTSAEGIAGIFNWAEVVSYISDIPF